MPQPTLHIIQRVTYAIAGQTVAVRVTGDPVGNNGLFYLYSDHLGSTSAIQNSIGGTPTINRYLPFGDYRPGSGPNDITDRAYTGQRENMDLGLYYYNARYYSPNTNRWVSPDSIIPDPADPQSFNRYSYTRNNPTGYKDPSGHNRCGVAGTICTDEPPLNLPSSTSERSQRINSLANNLLAWPASVASKATVPRLVQGIAPISRGPLNEIQLLPNGSFTRVPSTLAKASTIGSYGLPLISGVVNQNEIAERVDSGVITTQEAGLETVNNALFSGGASITSGYVIPKLATVSAVSIGPGTMAIGVVALGYDLNVAQGTVNNLIEGQNFGEAFTNARLTTNDRFTMGHGAELEQKLNQGAAIFADFIIQTVKTIRGD